MATDTETRTDNGTAPEDAELVTGELVVEGSGQLTLNVGGVVNEVGFKDEHDSKTGQVVGCQRNHKARITGIAVV
jgi:hypothetical protein